MGVDSDTETRAAESVPRVPWQQHLDAMAERYTDEDHISIIAPSRYGKSYLVKNGLLPLLENERLLVIDVKGDDPVWQDFPARRVTGKLPTGTKRKLIEWKRKQDDATLPRQWYQLITPESATREANRFAVYNAIETCKKEKKWVIVFDETRAITDKAPNGLNLAGALDSVWLRGGYKKVTVIACTQAPRWVPSAFYEQCHHLYIGQMQDINAQRRLSEIGGNTQLMISIVANLNKREFLYVGSLPETGGRVMEIVKVGDGA